MIIALLSGGSIMTVVLAQSQSPFEIPEVYIEEIYPRPLPPHPSITFAEGVAYDKEGQESKQVMFLVMKYGESKNIYLIIEDETYKMTELTNETYDLGPGTRIFRYVAEDGSILTILAQRFERWSQISISGDFKSYLIAFKPVHYYNYLRPTYSETGVLPAGVGKLQKEIRKELIEETRPVMKGLAKIAKREGVTINDLLQRPAKHIQEWID